jgi:hypothetical protein
MNGTWPNTQPYRPPTEDWRSIARNVVMPHTLITDRIPFLHPKPAPQKVVRDTSPPPLARDGNEARGQIGGLLGGMRTMEDKFDDRLDRVEDKIELLEASRAVSSEGEQFRHAVTQFAVSATPYFFQGNYLAVTAHAGPVLQNISGLVPALRQKPVSTVVAALAPIAAHLLHAPRQPLVVITKVQPAPGAAAGAAAQVEISIVSPDGGWIRYEIVAGAAPAVPVPNANSARYAAPFRHNDVAFAIRARAMFTPLRLGEETRVDYRP